MSVKPTTLPISPNDARSAIRVQKQLESDIARLREDIRRGGCNIPAAQKAIALKERQMTQIQAYLRQYHIDLEQFDRLETERHRQAIRRQHAIFEDQRRAMVPGKQSIAAKKARLDKSVKDITAPSLPSITLAVPEVSPAKMAEQRQAREAKEAKARAVLAQQQALAEQKRAEIERGAQARREEAERQKQMAIAMKEAERKAREEAKNITIHQADQLRQKSEEQREALKKAMHEKQMAEANARRIAEDKAKEAAMKQKQAAEKRAREAAAAEAQKKKEAAEKRAYMEMVQQKNAIEQSYRQVKSEADQMDMAVRQVDMEMQHAKVRNPEVLDDLREHRARLIEESINLKRAAGPMQAELNRIQNQMRRTVAVDQTAGLRAWHRDVLSSGHGRRQLAPSQRKQIQNMCASLSADQKEAVANLVARWEQGSDVNLMSEIQRIVSNNAVAQAQALGAAIAIQGTPRHVKHGMSAVAQNNFNRLRSMQASEDGAKAVAQASEQAAAAQGENLSGLFPKLRSSVTRMVGH